MGTLPNATQIWRFGVFEIDARTGELRRNGSSVKLREQSFRILVYLLENAGQMVTREELRRVLWPSDTFVDFDHSLNTAVMKLREALGDSADAPLYIETLPKRGYRFIAPVIAGSDNGIQLASPEPVNGADTPRLEPAVAPEPVPHKRRWELAAGMGLAALALTAFGFSLSDQNSYLSRTRLGTSLRGVTIGHRSKPQLPVSQRRLTANTDEVPLTSGVISPDGKYLAFSDPTGFYLRQVAGGETVSLPLPKGFDARPESWFPDSIHLVVSRVEDPKSPPSLWQISIMGGIPRKLVDRGSSARVSPDGSSIVFLAGIWDHQEIWLLRVNENSAQKIADNPKDFFGAPAWAPDGKRFAYFRLNFSIKPEIEIYDVTNGRTEEILSEPNLAPEIAWTTPGRLIYSLQEPEPNQNDFNLWWVKLDSRTSHPSGSPARITNDRNFVDRISVTSDGKQMAVLRHATQGDVYLTNVVAPGKQLSTPRRFTLDERQDFPQAWTPDSKAVLFGSDRDGPFHIFKQSLGETQPQLLVGGKDNVFVPRLSPDGLSVIYQVSPKPDEPSNIVRLMRVPLSGGPSQFVLEDQGINNQECARLPSTLCIYDQIESGEQRFFTFDPAGGKRTELVAAKRKTDSGGPGGNWGLSPDGKYLVSAKSPNPYEASALRVLNLTDGTERNISLSAMPLIMGLDWAPDSKSMWVGGFMGRGAWGSRSGLLNVDLNGKATLVLEGLNIDITGAVPSPDGLRLAVWRNTENSNVWLLENF